MKLSSSTRARWSLTRFTVILKSSGTSWIPSLRETIKEFSAIDGAFVIRGDGVIEAAGRHLNAAADVDLPPGLGARHMAAAGISDVSASTSFVISESTGTVSVFKNGKIYMQLGKAQPTKNNNKKKKS